MNIETLPFRLPDYGVRLNWGWFNSEPYDEDNSIVMNPGEFWAVFFFKKKNPRPGESKYAHTQIVKYLTPKGFNIFDGESFNMN